MDNTVCVKHEYDKLLLFELHDFMTRLGRSVENNYLPEVRYTGYFSLYRTVINLQIIQISKKSKTARRNKYSC